MKPTLFLSIVAASGCAASPSPDPEPVAPETFVVENDGTEDLEGHTPRGFQGQGTGLFVGDNLNAGFPQGDGVQVFLSFDLEDVPDGEVVSAELRAADVSTTGAPFSDLGALIAERVVFDAFSSALWDLAPESGDGCVLAEAADDPFVCDITEAAQDALDAGEPYLQLRLRLDQAGDSDGQQDLVVFNPSDSNENEPGLLEIELSVRPAE